MEQLNRIELRGTVGAVRNFDVGSKRLCRFSVATNYAYNSTNGMPVVETTWHQVVAWEGKGIETEGLKKGGGVEVTGRLRQMSYTAADGSQRTSYEVIASKVKPIEP
jgi:single-strand DNA-binding protein